MNILLKKIKKILLQEVIFIFLIISPLLLPDSSIELIKKIFESLQGTTVDQDITMLIVKIILIIVIYILIVNFNSKREFFNGDIYGDIPMFFYYIAKILGYKKISLIRKPYDIQFKIIKKDLFEILEDNIKEDEEVNVETDKSNFKYSNNLRECNLIIEDTYPITKEQIPKSKRDLDSIWIKRKKSSMATRVYSPKLINEVSKNVELIQETGAKINLYLTTNTKNTERIVKDVFMKGDRSKYNVELFLQKAIGNREFKERGIKV